MKKIRTDQLKEGMKFNKPVYIDGENILVPPGIPLKQKDIDRLKRWEIETVQTEGDIIDETEEKPGEVSLFEIFDMGDKGEYIRVYLDSIAALGDIFDEIRNGSEVYHSRIDDIVNALMEQIRNDKNKMIQLILAEEKTENKFAASAVNCTILSTVIGITMKFVSHKLIQLATGALLHDVGMLRISDTILFKREKLSEDELKQVKTHTLISYRIISQQLKYPEEIALIALQHHERWDGKGYPRKLRGTDISLAARIVSVADAYEAMVSERPYRNSMIGYNAMKEILSDNGRRFDPKVLKAFLGSMGIYPIGSIVQLNNSSIGRVVETNSAAPLRPKIELIIDEYGDRYAEREVIDLLQKKNLFIVKAIDIKQIEGNKS